MYLKVKPEEIITIVIKIIITVIWFKMDDFDFENRIDRGQNNFN